MKLLLDTHAFLWAAHDPEKLSKSALKAIRDPDSQLQLSIASFWEIGILQSLKRIELSVSIEDLAQRAVSDLGADLLPIEPVDIDRMRGLPFHHRDPFDRLLIAQAMILKASILGKDAHFDQYGVTRIW